MSTNNTLMYCPECGQKNESTSAFCEGCGTTLNENQKIIQQNPSNAATNFGVDSIMKNIKRIPKKVFAISGIAVAVIVIIITFFFIGKAVTDPTNIIKGYFEDLANGNYEKAFQYFEANSTDFINEKNFKKNIKDNAKIENLVDYTIKEQGIGGLSDEDKELMNQIGFSNLLAENNSEDDLKKSYMIKYTTKDNSKENLLEVALIKKDSKKLLFFDDYRIEINDFLVSDYMVEIPKGSEASIDGVLLTDIKKPDENTINWDTNQEIMDSYIVPLIFNGSHKLLVKNNLSEDYSEEININKGESTSVSELTLKNDIRKELADKAQEDYSKFFNAAIEGKEFNTVGLLCTSNTEKLNIIKNEYEKFTSIIKLNENGIGYQSVDLKKFIDNSEQETLNSELTYTCSIGVEYDCVKMVSQWYAEPKKQSFQGEERNFQFTYVYENGNWVLQNIFLGYYYNY